MWACRLSHFSHVWLFATLWTVVHQAPLSMGFSSQEYWSGLLCPSPGDLPGLGIEPASLMSLALSGRFFTASATWGVFCKYYPDVKCASCLMLEWITAGVIKMRIFCFRKHIYPYDRILYFLSYIMDDKMSSTVYFFLFGFSIL